MHQEEHFELSQLLAMTPEEREALFELDLSGADLQLLSNNEPQRWTKICDAISQCINLTTINLSGNSLGVMAPEHLQELYNSLLNCPLINLNLADNMLNSTWAEVFLNPNETTIFRSFIAKCVLLESINLASNELFTWEEGKLKLLGQLVKSSNINSLNLCFNNLHQVSFGVLQSLTAAFSSITTVYFSDKEINAMSEEQLMALGNAFPSASNCFVQNMKEEPVFSEKIEYLQSFTGQKNLLAAVNCLYQLTQPRYSDASEKLITLPRDAVISIAKFMEPKIPAPIQNGLKSLYGELNKTQDFLKAILRCLKEPQSSTLFSLSTEEKKIKSDADSLFRQIKALSKEKINSCCEKIILALIEEQKKAPENNQYKKLIETGLEAIPITEEIQLALKFMDNKKRPHDEVQEESSFKKIA